MLLSTSLNDRSVEHQLTEGHVQLPIGFFHLVERKRLLVEHEFRLRRIRFLRLGFLRVRAQRPLSSCLSFAMNGERSSRGDDNCTSKCLGASVSSNEPANWFSPSTAFRSFASTRPFVSSTAPLADTFRTGHVARNFARLLSRHLKSKRGLPIARVLHGAVDAHRCAAKGGSQRVKFDLLARIHRVSRDLERRCGHILDVKHARESRCIRGGDVEFEVRAHQASRLECAFQVGGDVAKLCLEVELPLRFRHP